MVANQQRMHAPAAPSFERDPRGLELERDVIVIGGGVDGVGVLRDATLRGFSVSLFERNAWRSALAHSSGFSTVVPATCRTIRTSRYSACLDSGHIQRVAPHLFARTRFDAVLRASGLKAKATLAHTTAFFTCRQVSTMEGRQTSRPADTK